MHDTKRGTRRQTFSEEEEVEVEVRHSLVYVVRGHCSRTVSLYDCERDG